MQRADLTREHVKLIWAEGQHAVAPEKLVALVAATPGARLLPPAGLFWPLPSAGSVGEALSDMRGKLESARLPQQMP